MDTLIGLFAETSHGSWNSGFCQEEVVQMEAELQELQSNCVVNSNEILGIKP